MARTKEDANARRESAKKKSQKEAKSCKVKGKAKKKSKRKSKGSSDDNKHKQIMSEEETKTEEEKKVYNLPFDMTTATDLFGTGQRNVPYSESSCPIAKKKWREYIRGICKQFEQHKKVHGQVVIYIYIYIYIYRQMI